jgi:amino acid efflux transporter
MSEIEKSLGVGRGTAMMLNIVLGAGLLTLPGLAAQAVGAQALLVWVACALAAAPLLLVFAILGRTYPDSGGIAATMRRAFGFLGEAPATLLFLGAVAVGLPAIALSGGHYAAASFGGVPHLYAAGFIVAATAVNLLSVRVAGAVNAVVASLVLVVLVAIAVLGWIAVSPGPEVVAQALTELPDRTAFALAFMMVFFAFTGWEVSANLSGEFRNPARDFPLAMALSFGAAVALYLLLAVIVAGAGDVAASEAPFAQIFRTHFGEASAAIVSVVSVVMIFANLSAAIWAVSRMVRCASQARLLPSPLVRLTGGVPLNAVYATTGTLLLVVLLSYQGIVDLAKLLAMAGQNFLLLYAGAAAALIRLGTAPWHRWLGWMCLMIVAALVAGKSGAALLYPAGLIATGGLAAILRMRRPITA